uniref:Uncharacterized protein n=1 Tax=Knipowitschia caucasica TaxID=637954 RepID=A0AAV2KIA1_KNICA
MLTFSSPFSPSPPSSPSSSPLLSLILPSPPPQVNHTLGSSMVCFDGPMAVGGDCVQMPPMVLLQLVATNRARVLSANFSSFFPQVDPNLATCSLELTLQFTDKEVRLP